MVFRVLDIARRVHDHTWKLDPIVRSLLDTDFYKLMMLQMIWKLHRDVDATFSLINRTTSIRLADEIDIGELSDQLDYARTVQLTKKEHIWLAGNSFYGRKQIFEPEFLTWLADFRLPDYELSVRDGQYQLDFHGRWTDTTMWEIPALAIINELRSRAAMRGMGPFELDVLYARAKAKMWEKVERLKKLDGLSISDFGTRRRHSFLWQRWCVQALQEGIPDAFTGTSNVLLAMDNDLEAVGTNAHELPMVYAALAETDAGIAAANYKVLEDWNALYGGNLRIVLPDTYGTAAFLHAAPDWVADWTGFRPDSAPPIEGVSGTDAQGFVGHTARCDAGDAPAAMIRTSLSLAIICDDGNDFYYRGERLRDGANRRIDNVRRSGDGFVAVSPDDGARYDVQPDQLTISSNGSVDSAEPALEYGSAQ